MTQLIICSITLLIALFFSFQTLACLIELIVNNKRNKYHDARAFSMFISWTAFYFLTHITF